MSAQIKIKKPSISMSVQNANLFLVQYIKDNIKYFTVDYN